MGADPPTLPDLPVVPWLRFAKENTGFDGSVAGGDGQDNCSIEGAMPPPETGELIHGFPDVCSHDGTLPPVGTPDPSDALGLLPGCDVRATSHEVTVADTPKLNDPGPKDRNLDLECSPDDA